MPTSLPSLSTGIPFVAPVDMPRLPSTGARTPITPELGLQVGRWSLAFGRGGSGQNAGMLHLQIPGWARRRVAQGYPHQLLRAFQLEIASALKLIISPS